MPSLYDILEIPNTDNELEIKRAYFRLVKIYSPEKAPDKFKEIKKAYDTLSNKDAKKSYDSNFLVSEEYIEPLLEAQQLLESSQSKKAVSILKKLAKADPDSVQIQLTLANAFIKNNNMGNAQKIYEKLISQEPNNQQYNLKLANLFGLRGYKVKVREQFEAAIELDKTNADAWVEYINYLIRECRWLLEAVIKKAEDVSPDIFKEHYYIYISACNSHRYMFFYEDELIGHFFKKFAEFFAVDEGPLRSKYYKDAINMAYDMSCNPECCEDVEIILPALEAYDLKTDEHKDKIKEIKENILFSELDNDAKIEDIISDLTHVLSRNDNSLEQKLEIFGIEYYIVLNISGLRKSIKHLKSNYPEYYKLGQQFYEEVLSQKSYNNLMERYASEFRSLYKKHPDIFADKFKVKKGDSDALFDDDYYYDDEDDYESEMPYKREEPKVGRNEPCPCGSGKKYKKCCGA